MPGQFPTSMGSIAAVATLLACVGIPTTIARAADCLTAPYFSAPEGSQWYYQTDRATKRKCWFLRAKNQSTQQPAAQAESEAAPATRTTAFEQPATASIGVRNSAASQTSAQPAGPAAGVGAGVPTTIARADDCLTAPNSPAPAGRRWSYRTDRSTQRKCWYVRAADGRTQHTDAQAPSTVSPAKKTRALENATASAGAPLSKSSAEGARPLPSLKPQPMGSATTADLVDQSAPAENTSPSSRERPSPQTAQATSPATAAGSPDLPAVATASVAEPNAAASDARADSLRPTLDARARDDAEGPARGGPSTASTTGTAISLTGTLVQMFLIVAAGLGVASLLYRVVTAATRRRQNSIDHLEADGIGDQNARDNQQQYRSVDERDQFVDDLHSSTIAAANDRDDQQQHRSVDDRDQLIEDLHRSQISGANDRDDPQHHRSVDDRNPFIDDLHRSLISGANDYDARRPHPTDDDWPNNRRRAGGACHITDDVSKREDTLAQLRRDLDRLLQPNSREDQQQHGSSAEPEQFIDDLQRAPISSANDNGSGEDDHDARRPADDAWPNNTRRTGGASQITDEVSERDNRLSRLRRDLNSLLQSSKSA